MLHTYIFRGYIFRRLIALIDGPNLDPRAIKAPDAFHLNPSILIP